MATPNPPQARESLRRTWDLVLEGRGMKHHLLE